MPGAAVDVRAFVEAKRTIAEHLAPFNALGVLGWLSWLSLGGAGPGGGGASDIVDVVEYVSAVLLERPSAAPLAAPASPRSALAGIDQALERATEARNDTIRGYWHARYEQIDPFGLLALDAELDDTLHRFPGYVPQGRALLAGCFADDDDVAALLREQLGFDGLQAVALEAAYSDAFAQNCTSWRDTVHERLGLVHSSGGAVIAQTGPGDVMEVVLEDLFERGAYEHCAVAAEDLQQRTGLPVTAVEGFVRAFSIDFGELRGGRPLLTGRNEVRGRPLVRTPAGRYLPISAGNLLWAIRPRLEAALRRDRRLWNPYQERRAAYVERSAAQLLGDALQPDQKWTNVTFRLERDRTPWEADVLVRLDAVCFVVEVKAGTLSAKARQGRHRELRQDLQGLLGKSSRQAARLSDAVRAGQEVMFTDRRTGLEVPVDLVGVDRIEPVVVTLEDLTLVASSPATLRAAGIIDDGAQAPWTVSIWDLEIITRALEFPAQLTRYVAERRCLDPRAWFNDEQELWLAYLAHGFDFSRITQPVVVLGGRVDALRRQWALGAAAPAMPLRASERRRLRAFHRDRQAGWLHDAEALIADVQRRERLSVPRTDARGQRPAG